MTADERAKLADELAAYASKYSDDWAMASPTISWGSLKSIVAALRTPAADATIDSVPSCGQENDYRRAAPEADAGAVAAVLKDYKFYFPHGGNHWGDKFVAALSAAGIAAPPEQLRCEMCAGSKWKDACPECNGTGWYTPDAEVAPPAASADAVRNFCTFGPPGERAQQWIILFQDADRGMMIFDNEQDAHTKWDRAKDNWTCTLYETSERKYFWAAGELRALTAPVAGLSSFTADLIAKQGPLGAEFSKVLHDNLSEMYIPSEAAPVAGADAGMRERAPFIVEQERLPPSLIPEKQHERSHEIGGRGYRRA